MKYLILLLLVLFGFNTSQAQKNSFYKPNNAAPNKYKGYELVWNDEFNNKGIPDTANWGHEIGFKRNHELQWYQPQNAYCENGTLIIEGKRERVANTNYDKESTDWRRNREYAEYTASSINTSKKHLWTYGRFEIRARIPYQKGAWPAIWTLGKNMEWPSCGEIDILELYKVNDTTTILANVASGTDKRFTAKWKEKKIRLSYFLEKDHRWLEKFHVWRMDWDEDYIRLYLDDELLNEVKTSETINPDGTKPFAQSQFLLLNLAIGGNGGNPDKTDFPLIYEVDYARVYQRK